MKKNRKNFAMLSGAYVNAGDFLIVDRTIQLLKHFYPGCHIKTYERRFNIEPHLQAINNSDALIIAGGPAYCSNMYPDVLPLVDNLDRITTKIVIIGSGWWGKNDTLESIYNYRLSASTKQLLNRIVKDSHVLSCRGVDTEKALFANGLSDTIISGCPAWYNLNYLQKTTIRGGATKGFNKICISDPGSVAHFDQAIEVAKLIKGLYPRADISFVSHRIGTDKEAYASLHHEIRKLGIKIKDISGSAKGFHIYDDCDFHIGFRVHAHIYNLSCRNISLLIEEDGRGAEVNKTLTLPRILSEMPVEIELNTHNIVFRNIYRIEDKLFKRPIVKRIPNPYFIQDIQFAINSIKNNDFRQYEAVFKAMQSYFKNMQKIIKNIDI